MQAQENRDKLIVLRAEHKALQMKIQQIQDLLAKKESPKVSTLPFYEDAWKTNGPVLESRLLGPRWHPIRNESVVRSP